MGATLERSICKAITAVTVYNSRFVLKKNRQYHNQRELLKFI